MSTTTDNALHGVVCFFSETGTEGGYWAFQEAGYITTAPDGTPRWDIAGLHLLQDGDLLTIFHHAADTTRILWQGEIDLVHYPPFTQAARGMWIHADQRGVERSRWADWFFGEHPAHLVPHVT